MRGALVLLSIFIVAVVGSDGKEKPDARLRVVTSVFIAGNNQAAEKARTVLRSGRTCLVLAPRASDADAVLEVSVDTQTQGGMIGGFGGRTWIASGTLTLRSGELIWSRSERFSDAPFMSGGKVSGGLLVGHLSQDAGCKKRSE
jgi:hypothetical protein